MPADRHDLIMGALWWEGEGVEERKEEEKNHMNMGMHQRDRILQYAVNTFFHTVLCTPNCLYKIYNYQQASLDYHNNTNG